MAQQKVDGSQLDSATLDLSGSDGSVLTGVDADQLGSQLPAFYQDAGNLNAGTLLDARVAQSNVTQHEAALSIAGSQLTGTVDADTLGGQPVGTGANDIVALNASSQLPAVNGSLITSLNATSVASGTLNAARLATSGVAAASYTNADITVDNKGRVTAASSGASASYVSFNARQAVSSQSISPSTWTKVQFDTLRWDTNGYFSTGLFRFTPLLAGKYVFDIRIRFSTGFGMVAGNNLSFGLAKSISGSGGLVSTHGLTANADGMTMNFSTTQIANGTTDFFEAWIWHNNAATQHLANGVTLSEFSAHFVGP